MRVRGDSAVWSKYKIRDELTAGICQTGKHRLVKCTLQEGMPKVWKIWREFLVVSSLSECGAAMQITVCAYVDCVELKQASKYA